MKNHNEQPSVKQKSKQEMQNQNGQAMKNRMENHVESCSKNKEMKNQVKKEMRVDNHTIKNTRKEQ